MRKKRQKNKENILSILFRLLFNWVCPCYNPSNPNKLSILFRLLFNKILGNFLIYYIDLLSILFRLLFNFQLIDEALDFPISFNPI